MNQEQQSVRSRLDPSIAIRAHGVVEVPAELALRESELIDRLLALAFDVLGWQTIEIRIRPRIVHGAHIA
jgi:hypothetical protein